MSDGTGPRGIGPMTGRGLGFCANGERRRFDYGRCQGYGQGVHLGYGRKQGWSREMAKGVYHYGEQGYPVIEETEKSFLENQKRVIQERLDIIEERLGDINEKDE